MNDDIASAPTEEIPPAEARLDDLIVAYSLGEANDSQLQELLDVLRKDDGGSVATAIWDRLQAVQLTTVAASRSGFSAAVQIAVHDAVQRQHGGRKLLNAFWRRRGKKVGLSPVDGPDSVAPTRRLWPWFLLIACLLFGGIAAAVFWQQAPVAQVTVGRLHAGDGQEVAAGRDVQAGTSLGLETGSAAVDLVGGGQINLTGPAQVQIWGQDRLLLRSGSAVVSGPVQIDVVDGVLLVPAGGRGQIRSRGDQIVVGSLQDTLEWRGITGAPQRVQAGEAMTGNGEVFVWEDGEILLRTDERTVQWQAPPAGAWRVRLTVALGDEIAACLVDPGADQGGLSLEAGRLRLPDGRVLPLRGVPFADRRLTFIGYQQETILHCEGWPEPISLPWSGPLARIHVAGNGTIRDVYGVVGPE